MVDPDVSCRRRDTRARRLHTLVRQLSYPLPLHVQRAKQGSQERAGSGSDDGAFDIRSTDRERSAGTAQASG